MIDATSVNQKSRKDWIKLGKPLMGISLGTQIILDCSEENETDCIGLVAGSTKRFPDKLTSGVQALKIPHMGWNQVGFTKSHPVLNGIPDGADFYFVHSFYPAPTDRSVVLGETGYGGTVFPSLLARRNVLACQFHAEKSGPYGLRLLKNFCAWDGKE